jgi:uncharacterized membrane protein YqjE
MAADTSNDPGPVPLTRALRGVVDHGLALCQVRLELLGVEAREALDHGVAVLSWLFVAAVALAVGLVFVSVLITVALWDHHRLLALMAFSVLFLTVGGGAAWQVRRLLRQSARPFSASVAELRADRERLRPRPASGPAT